MSRIKNRFSDLAQRGKKALIPFITAGDPNLASTVQLMHALARSGSDIIELGIPFSDPMADGPVIQRASERALKNGVGLSDVIQCVREFRLTDASTPVVLMGYANPVERMGLARFVAESASAGVDGVLIVDYPPEECRDLANQLQQHDIDLIFLLAPTSTEKRIQEVAEIANGYVYYVSMRGVTGNQVADLQDVRRKLGQIKEVIGVPVVVGFGIRDRDTARQISQLADGVVIGSRIIEEIEACQLNSESLKMLGAVENFVHEIRVAID